MWGSCFWFCIPGFSSSSRRLRHNIIHTITYNNIQYNTQQHTHNTQQHTHNNTQQHTTTHQHTHTTTTTTHQQHTNTHAHTHNNTQQLTTTHNHTNTWQAWHLVTSTLISRGRRGTTSHLPSFCVAGVGQMALGGALGAGLGAAVTPVTPRHFCVAGVALGDIHLDFTWHGPGLGAAVTPVTPRHFCVAGVALGDIHLDFTWQAWHNLTSTVVLRGRRGTDGPGWRPWAGFRRRRDARDAAPLLRGRRGTWWHPPWFHVAGVAQPHIYRRLPSFCVAGVGQMALGGALGPGLGAAVTPVTPRHFCVAGVALGDIHLDFTWQAWHNLTSTVVLRGRRGTDGPGWRPWAGFRRRRDARDAAPLLRGRRGTWWHPPWFHVAGVAQPHIYRRFAWQAWDRWPGLGAAVTPVTPRHFCVAGVALGDIHLDFTWHGPGLGAAVTPRHFCVASVALGDIHLDFTWQAWHNLTSTVVLRGRRGTDGPGWRPWAGFRRRRDARDAAPLLRGRRGTWWHPPWFHVAGVAQPHIYRRFAWQAWDRWHWVAPLGRV